MSVEVISCDRCGNSIDEEGSARLLSVRRPIKESGELRFRLDLCDDCFLALRRFITQGRDET